jgi:hypothetical protein
MPTLRDESQPTTIQQEETMEKPRAFIRASEITDKESEYKDNVVPRRGNLDQRRFAQLFKDCFEHHVTTVDGKHRPKIEVLQYDPKRFIAVDVIASEFRSAHIVDFRISATRNSNDRDFDDNVVSTEELVVEVTAHPLHSSRPSIQTGTPTNRICFLIGNVGRGKSLLVSKIVENIRATEPVNDTWRALPIYFDCEQLWRGEDGKLRNVNEAFFEKLYDQLLSSASNDAVAKDARIIDYLTRNKHAEDTRTAKAKLLSLAQHLRQNNFYVFLALDNIDRFHFGLTKYAFFEQYAREQEKSIERNVLQLIRIFNNNEELGTLGAAVLIVCRRYVFDHLAVLDDGCGPNSLCLSDYTVFSMKSVPVERITQKRLELFSKLVTIVAESAVPSNEAKEQIVAGKDLLLHAIDVVGQERESADKVLGLIGMLCHQGLRSFIGFVSTLALDYRNQCELIRRVFVTQTHNLLRLYITNSRQRYSEEAGHFPNVYMNDTSFDISQEFLEAHTHHQHTYWLRYFILSTLNAAPGSKMRFDELRQLFVERAGYEDALFRLTIGQMAMPERAGLIQVVFSATGPSGHVLSPTPRGRALIGTQRDSLLYGVPLCFSFHYLQLVIDDPRLQLPAPWANEIVVNESLWYTLKPTEEFNRQSFNYLERKMPACLKFFNVLKASFKAEKKQRSALFSDAKRATNLTPDFEALEIHLLAAFTTILRHFPSDRSAPLAESLKELHDSLSKSKVMEDHFAMAYQTQAIKRS